MITLARVLKSQTGNASDPAILTAEAYAGGGSASAVLVYVAVWRGDLYGALWAAVGGICNFFVYSGEDAGFGGVQALTSGSR